MQIIDSAATRQHLGFAPLIDALRSMFVSGCEVPLRHTHTIADEHGAPRGSVLLMPAWRAGSRFGLKTVMIFPGNGAIAPHGLPGLHSTYLLYDANTGQPLAQLDGNEITTRRTAAAAALAASHLARPDARRLLIVGAGRVAALLAEAMRVVRPIDEVIVWNHRPTGAQALAAALREVGINARANDDLAASVAAADIVSCATLSNAALIQGRWLRPGTHLDLIGSFSPQMREADAACFERARVYVDTPEALTKSGDLLGAIAEGTFAPTAVQGTLADLCAGRVRGRTNADEITLFKAVGSALEDLAAAELVLDGATAAAARPREVRWYWEDFPVGQVREFGLMPVTRDAVLAFARQFDPQRFHVDDEAAKAALFGALSASGWHTCAMAMRMMCDDYLLESSSLGSPGIDNLRWLKPVFPGDTLRMRLTVLDSRVMRSRPQVGLVQSSWDVLNQHGDVVLSMTGWGMFGRREGEPR